MTIAKKVMIALCMTSLMVLICILIPVITSNGLGNVRDEVSQFESLQGEVGLSQDLQLQIANVWQFLTDASLTREKDSIEKEAKPAYEKAQKIISQLLESNKDDAAHSAKLKKLQQSLPGMWQTGVSMFDAYGRSFAEGNKTMEEYDKACDLAIKTAEEITAKCQQDGREQRKQVNRNLNGLAREVTGSGAVATVMGIAVIIMMILLRRSIALSLKKIIDEVSCLTKGDLSRKFDSAAGDEVAQVAGMLNQFIEKLHLAVSAISSTSNQVSTASEVLQSTAGTIAQGAEEVAQQAGTVATAGEEMSATSGNIAQNCQMAAEEAERASHSAREGVEVVGKTVAVMGAIAGKVQESAKTVESLGARGDQIGAIIGTIEDIAEQTNLLALNAAIEAARAGEQGRGFAVVADEVRALAERTTRATKEIGAMIKAIQSDTQSAVCAMEQGVRQVESGTMEAARSGEALQGILEHIDAVAAQVNMIATAAGEQTATTSEIAGNIYQITELAQQTSRGAQESTAAAAHLRDNALDLQRLVRQFQL
jgi:methyl-accepting chemotaxis protein